MSLANRDPLLGGVLQLVIRIYVVFGLQGKLTNRGLIKTGKIVGVLSVAKIRDDKEFGITRGGDSRGNGGLVLGLKLKGARFYSTNKNMPSGIMKLEQLIKDNQEDKLLINHQVSNIVKNIDILTLAYGRIKSNPGNMSKGSSDETLDGIDLNWFKRISNDIGTGSFKFTPARRVEIPKSKGGTRPLGVGNTRQKVVQEAMRLVLNAIFEPTFSSHSHGFIYGKSCHTALNDINLTFEGVNWFLEGDISKCFDTFDHKLLIRAVECRIKDQVFIDLLWKALRTGHIDSKSKNNFITKADLGTPQGSLISPVLCNIYLTKLDHWIHCYQKEFNVGSRKQANPVYTKLLRAIPDKLGKKTLEDKMEIRKLIHRDGIRPTLGNELFKRLFYVRYADDFIIGVHGSHKDTSELKNKLTHFMREELLMELSETKIIITHATEGKANFLGYRIANIPQHKKDTPPIKVSTRLCQTRPVGRIRFNPRPQLTAPVTRISNKLKEAGFARGSNNSPTRNGSFIHYDLATIIEKYLLVARGILNYYSGCSNYTVLRARVLYILKYSCALTFASKLKLRTCKKVFNKFGYDLAVTSDGQGSSKGSQELRAYYDLQKSQSKNDVNLYRGKQILRKKPLRELDITKDDLPIVFDEKLFPRSAPGFNKKSMAMDLNIDSFIVKMGKMH